MAKVLILDVLLLLVLSHVESCFIPSSLHLIVPQTIPVGYKVTKVEAADCDPASMIVTLNDPSFTILSNGDVVARSPVTVETRGRTFSVLVQDNKGPQSEMEVHLIQNLLQKPQHFGKDLLRRSKRRWSPPPFNILENDVGPYPKEIEKLVSDSVARHDVYYTISGPGYDQNPVGVFKLDSLSGMLSVLKSVDREQFPMFVLTARVFDKKTNQETDLPLPIQILVDDVNDNAPQFEGALQFVVLEHSPVGTVVGKVNATDRDQRNTLHVKIRYSLLSGRDMFAIDPDSGVLTTLKNTMDREVNENFNVIVEIKDMAGAATGLFSTGTATITVGDINDHPPTFKTETYQVKVNENEKEKLLLRIPVDDKDLINTPNWISKFVITKGNDKGNFRVDRDPKTNEGLLYVSKALDYEKATKLNLEIMARNEADLKGTTAKWNSIPVTVAVGDIDEGPQFTAPTITFTVKENTPNGTVIGSYTAVDPETKTSKGIRYYKVTDPGSWITADTNTGELKVANTIDRESPLCQNGMYNVTMKAVDASSKSGTGTVIIMVEDVNDNKPELPTADLVLCEKEGELGSVLVVAKDSDRSPFSDPFTFNLPKDHDGKWSVTRFNNTAATLQQMKELPTGLHKVPLDVTDLQGSGGTQTANVRICQCRNGVCIANPLSKSLGPLALLTMLLPLALLLLLCLLLGFFCMTTREKIQIDDTGDSGGILLKSNTEAPGEEVDSSLINVPTHVVEPVGKGSVKGSMLNAGWLGNKSSSTIGAHDTNENMMYKSGYGEMQEFYSGQYTGTSAGHLVGSAVGFDNRHLTQDSTFLQTWQTNGRYLQQKLAFFGTEEDGRYADDVIHPYGYEGVGSAAGSVGCCSDFGDNDNLDFLNTLGPKFKTLAGVCKKT